VLDQAYVDELRAAGVAAGLDRVGVALAAPFAEALVAIRSRKASGQHAGMQFTFRNPERSTDPRRTMADVRSLVVGAKSYPAAMPDRPHGEVARVARYAAADHYAALRDGLGAVARRLRRDGWRAQVVLDDNRLVDRAAAHRAGIGWFGKNANILSPGLGSWFVIGSVLTDAVLPAASEPVPDGCGTCSRCIDSCPTGAIVAPGVVDARRCLAWLVQAEGDIPVEFRSALGDRIYGCDDCQEVCPPNRAPKLRARPAPATGDAWVELIELLLADDDELLTRHGRWYIPRRDARYLRRNALVALGNVGGADTPEVVDVLRAYMTHPDPMLREHATWAGERLGVGALAR
jgi:epoxyqueuosine reductase